MVSNTTELFPEPETPVKIVIRRLGIDRVTSRRLFSRAPRISMYSVTSSAVEQPLDLLEAGGEGVDVRLGRVDLERRSGGGAEVEALVERHRAVVTGPDG